MKKNFCLALLFTAALLPVGLNAQNNITLPWSEDFDVYSSVGGSSMPAGWTRVVGFHPSSSSATYPNFTTYSGHGTVLNFMGQGSVSDGSGMMKIATPLIPAPLNNLEFSFEVFKNGLTVYLATDPADASTYTLVGSYSPGWSWTTVEVRTDTLTGAPSAQGYLVFCGNYGASGYSTAYLDNVYVTSMNPCQRPSEVEVARVGVTSALLSWPEVQGAWSYNVTYSTHADMSDSTVLNAYSGGITITGLEPDMHYYVQVTTVCGEGEESDPRAAEFTTQMSCYSIVNLRQVSVCSDAAAFQWEYDVRGNDADGVVTYLRDLSDPSVDDYEEPSSGSNYHFFSGLDRMHQYLAIFRTVCGADTADAVSVPIVFRNCGETELAADSTTWANDHPLNPFYNYTYSQMVYPAEVFYDMDTIRGLALRRHLRAQSATTTRTLSIWLANTTATSSASPVSTTSMTQVANNVAYTLVNQEWDTLMFATPFVYDGTSNVVVTIVDNTGTHTSSSAAPYWLWHSAEWQMHYKSNDDTPYDAATPPSVSHKMHLPDMRFVGLCNDENPCEAPVLVVSAVDSATATVEWTAGTVYTWTVEYRTLGGGAWASVPGVTATPYVITGLTPDTRYEVRLAINCNGQTRYSNSVPFTTVCAMQHIPFHFTQSDLEAAVANGGFTDCWSFSPYIYRGRLSDSHRAYLRNVDHNQWIMLPAVAEHLSGARLRTWCAVSSASMVRVGVAGQSDCSDVVWVDTIYLPNSNPNTSTSEYIAYLDSYEGDGNRVVLSPVVDNEYTFVYFFDFHIEPVEGCRPVVGLTLDEADSNSLTFHWTPVGAASQWLVYVDGVEQGIASSPSYTVSGLNPYTEYDITIRTYCGEGDTSLARSATFLTGCTGASCTFTVEAVSATHNGWNGGFLEMVSGNRVIGTVRMTNGSNLSRTFMVCDGMPLAFNWYSGNADDVCSFVIRNEAGTAVFQCDSAVELGAAFFAIDSICAGIGPGPGPEPQGIAEANGANVVLSPNPATNMVTVMGVEPGATVTLMDLSGRENGLWTAKGTSMMISLRNLSRGAYYVRIVGEKATVIKKMVVQ